MIDTTSDSDIGEAKLYELIGRLQVDRANEKSAHARTFAVLKKVKDGEIKLDDLRVTPVGWKVVPSPNGEK